ncbi:hypothetical protein [Nitrosopumilus ureiphilus]|uniref:Uncharacterized protein n=1 Tax=Nitrosopumilus ureiphilus TaxID=1470067 RepID=A0A7D5R1H8_9ARCH|nr:hypothetical protein [Nitrosopumilus ureiphilus]QLH06616.1 hypothetical protein C5F50_05675 [Nitrosopumilus ureiphilus]
MKKSTQQTIESPIPEKPIQYRLRQASCITVESAIRNKVNLNISWYDVHGEEQSQKYSISAGSVIEL